MPRRVQDIVPNGHRSIRDIPVERTTRSAGIDLPKKKPGRSIPIRKPQVARDDDPIVEAEEERGQVVRRMSVTPPHRTKRSHRTTWPLFLAGIIVVVAGVGYAASVYFSYATFKLSPKTLPISVNGTYIAQSATSNANLTYELAAVRGSAAATVPAIDGPQISTTATGRVTLYNAYASQSQRLIAGTRLADSTGRIYRLTGSVVVPGYTVSGGSIIPGSITASVTADQPGQSYNITRSDSISDFTIVAYKGTPRYESMYARLSTDITGGYIGTKKTVAAPLLASTTLQLREKIIATLLAEVADTMPEGYILYPDAYVASFTNPLIDGNDPKAAVVTVQGTLHAILFKKDELVARVAGEQAVATFDDFAYETPGLEELEFSIANQKDFSPEKKNTLIIKLKGEATLVGTIPIAELKTRLAGLSLAETGVVLRAYKPVIDIEKSSGEVTPPWSKIPSDPDRITVEVLTK